MALPVVVMPSLHLSPSNTESCVSIQWRKRELSKAEPIRVIGFGSGMTDCCDGLLRFEVVLLTVESYRCLQIGRGLKTSYQEKNWTLLNSDITPCVPLLGNTEHYFNEGETKL